ncbi:MAG: DUF2178 domain-containing protein [Methanosarcinaceae archaeon]|nr:DUF2178 domain-containing protein [Methanosarcinaceae archaeon]
MKFRRDGRILKFMGISLGVILVGILILQFLQPIAIIGITFISCGLVGFMVGLRISSKPVDYFIEDERSVRIKEKAGYSAYGVMTSVAVIIMFLGMVKISPSLTPSGDFIDGALVMWVIGLYTFIILRWYYSKTGE